MRSIRLAIAAAALLAGSISYAATGAIDVPKNGGEEQRAKISDLELRGDLARIHGDYFRSIDYYRSAIRLDSKNSKLYNKLGVSELKADMLRAAKSDFAKSSKLDPKFAAALNNLGAVACMEKKYSAATKYLKQALALDETDAPLHVNLGEAWLGLGQMDRALAEYSRALELDGDIFSENQSGGTTAKLHTAEQRAAAAYLIARMYAKRGNLEGALEQLRRAKENHYAAMANVYKDQEFAALWNDPRLKQIVSR
jgi:tetratricopeptide (TPR) repeat protein